MAILFIGRSTLDLGYVAPNYPEEDTKVSCETYYSVAGGPSLNAAITATALGSESRLCTLLGAGCFADAVRKELARYGVTCRDHAPENETILPVSGIVIVPGNGTRTVLNQYRPEPVERIEEALADLDGAQAVLTDGRVPDLAVPVLEAAHERGIPVVFDGGTWKGWTHRLIGLVDHAILSARFRPPGIDNAEDVIDAVHALGPSHVAVTRGGSSIRWSANGESDEIKPPQIKAVDSLGAGDIYHGAYCHYLVGGDRFPDALEKASAVAAESVRYFGTREWIDRRA